MCTAGNATMEVINGALGVFGAANDIYNERKENKYRTQIAINNAKNAQNEALRQKQMGIEKSRIEKIAGMQKMNNKIAKDSASGFDLNSLTNQYNYSDILSSSDESAKNIQNEYNQAAENYFRTANSYLNEANNK